MPDSECEEGSVNFKQGPTARHLSHSKGALHSRCNVKEFNAEDSLKAEA